MNQPTKEQIDNARRTGFRNALAHRPASERAKLEASYERQYARREKNVTQFRNQVSNK